MPYFASSTVETILDRASLQRISLFYIAKQWSRNTSGEFHDN